MKFDKPNFWDYKKPNFLAYLLLPFAYLFFIISYLQKKKSVKMGTEEGSSFQEKGKGKGN